MVAIFFFQGLSHSDNDDDIVVDDPSSFEDDGVAPINVDTGDYEFATHVVKVRRSGEVTEVLSLWELEGKELGDQLWLDFEQVFTLDSLSH